MCQLHGMRRKCPTKSITPTLRTGGRICRVIIDYLIYPIVNITIIQPQSLDGPGVHSIGQMFWMACQA